MSWLVVYLLIGLLLLAALFVCDRSAWARGRWFEWGLVLLIWPYVLLWSAHRVWVVATRGGQ